MSGITVPNCPICGLKRPLLLQVYAPLDNSAFHRTLYVFGCLIPSCSTQSISWLCLRSQVMEKQSREREGRDKKQQRREDNSAQMINWCSGADDWGVDEDGEEDLSAGLDNDQFVSRTDEENGNIIVNDNYRQLSDEDDESTSTAELLTTEISMMQIDEDNANCNGAGAGGQQLDGAVGPMCPFKSQASAEIEREETDDLVTIDTPESPHRDLIALLKQTSALRTDGSNSMTLNSFFLFVEEEVSEANPRISEHVRDLLQEYQQRKDESE